jgi:Multiubiquitin
MSPSEKRPEQPKKIVIHIDRTKFEVEDTEMTGTELRALPEPDIGSEFDLWLEVPGGEDDRIEADEPVRLKNGTHFFTAPSTINPGRAH